MENIKRIFPDRLFSFLKMVIFSYIGIFIFFIDVPFNGQTTIIPAHLANIALVYAKPFAVAFVMLLIFYGALSPFVQATWNKSKESIFFSFIKVFGLIVTVLYLLDWAPSFITAPGMMPFLFEKLVLNLGLIVPIGAVALSFLICFGLIEFCSIFMEPVMQRIWRTPGYSSVDAAVSFVGSYSIGMLITNRMYLNKSYSLRHAVIITTGFSTVSVAFMVVVAKVLGLLEFWNYYFWSTLVITFAVTAITARLPPITNYDNSSEKNLETDIGRKGYFKTALETGLTRVEENPPLYLLFWQNIRDGLRMTSVILPIGVGVGLIGLLLSKYTPVFDWLGMLYYPLLSILQVPEAMLTAKALAAGLAEMFFPTGMLGDAPMMSRYIYGVASVSSVLFFAGSIPCILATDIPIKIVHLVIIWFIRVMLTIPLAVLAAHLGPVLG